MVKVSIVVPVHDAEPYLHKCMENLINQTLKEIEIICVDDGSRDMSLEILESYQTKDPRIKLLKHDAARGTMVARKVGTMAAEGEYLMYIDPDDYLELEACELLYNKITEKQVDILQFNSRVINCGNLTEQEIRDLYTLLRPCFRRLKGRQILDALYNKREFYSTVWNKIYRTEVCKRAQSELEDRFQLVAEDICALFFTAYYAESYIGWDSPPLYNYFIGRGITGYTSVNMRKFRNMCSQVDVIRDLERFCKRHQIWPQYKKSLEYQKREMMEACVGTWVEKIPREFGVQGMQVMFDSWGVENIIPVLYKNFGMQRKKIAAKLAEFPRISLARKEVKTVAFFYHTLGVGGLERVIAALATMLDQMGCRVVMIIESEPTKLDYPLPDTVIRETIQKYDFTSTEDVSKRLEDWKRLVETYHIDVVLHSAWVCPVLLWDMLYLKTLDVPVIVHCHSVFSFSMTLNNDLMIESRYTLPLSDGMVVLSPADQVYYSAYHDNVYYIPNPVSESLRDAELSDGAEPSIVWVGRNSVEKQPQSVFPIMRCVVSQVPEAKLYMVGDFTDKHWKNMAREYGVENNIVFCGQTHDVGQYYHRASVFLSTSQYEGFSMVLLEAQAHGLPSVIYDMPNLEFSKPGRGVSTVGMDDDVSAAFEIVKLLSDKELWRQQSELARKNFRYMADYDIGKDWKALLSGEKRCAEVSQPMLDLCDVVLENYGQGLQHNGAIIGMNASSFSVVEHKGSYKVGLFITYIPRKIWGGIRCVGENGFMYTLRLFFTKVKNKFGKVFLGWDV